MPKRQMRCIRAIGSIERGETQGREIWSGGMQAMRQINQMDGNRHDENGYSTNRTTTRIKGPKQ